MYIKHVKPMKRAHNKKRSVYRGEKFVRKKSIDIAALLLVLLILLGLIFLFATLAAYHQLTACAEAFEGADDAMAAKWRSLCTWQVVIIGCFGAFLTLLLLLGLSSASFFYFYNGGMIVLLLFILAIAIALGVVKIIELVYLNRSAKLYE